MFCQLQLNSCRLLCNTLEKSPCSVVTGSIQAGCSDVGMDEGM